MNPMHPEGKSGHDQPVSPHNITLLPRKSLEHTWKQRMGIFFCMMFIFCAFWAGYRYAHEYVRFGIQGHDQINETAQPQSSAGLATKWSIPADMNVTKCGQWVRGRYYSSTSLELPISSNKLFLLSRGSSAGSLTVVQSKEAGDVAKVFVVTKYIYQNPWDHVVVCTLVLNGHQNGVGLFSPSWSKRTYVDFEIIVHLPAGSPGTPLHVKNFETNLPLFSHHLGDIEQSTTFDEVSLTSSMMPIHVETLNAKNVRITTTKSPITGVFNTSSSLELRTWNAPIEITASLLNKNDTEATRLTITTSIAKITANVSLISGAGTGGKFKVSGRTSLSDLDINFITAPVESSLLLDAQTSLKQAKVKLHETYQGTFDLSTSILRPHVLLDTRVKDPAGKHRKRNSEVRLDGPLSAGSVSWSDEGEKLGHVKVRTSFSSLVLQV